MLAPILGALILIGYYYGTSGVYVRITNNTQNPLAQVRVTYTGGTADIGVLMPKTSYGRRINPDGESHLELEWVDSSGERRSYSNGYFEHNYRGRIDIVVEPNSDPTWIDNSRPFI